jgi:probable HAF family extracellular repeat protein
MGTRRRSILAAAGLLAAFAATIAAAAPAVATTAPTRTTLPTLGGCCGVAQGMNGYEIVGYSFTASNEMHAVVWRTGRTVTVRDLGTIGGSFSAANAVNVHGDVAGYASLPGGTGFPNYHAVLWRHGKPVDLGTLGGDLSFASAVNSHGDVVGWSLTADGLQHAFRWHDGRMTDLGTLPGAFNSIANGVNDRGDVVGVSDGHAVLWRGGTVVDLGGGSNSSAQAINNHGDIVGYGGSGAQQPVRWHDGQVTVLDAAGGVANAVNERGDAAGWSSGADGHIHATVWRHGQAVDLGPDAQVNAIDNRGRLAGWVPIMNSQALFWR